MTTPLRPRPEGSLEHPDQFPAVGQPVWLVCRHMGRKWIDYGLVDEVPPDFQPCDSRFFGLRKLDKDGLLRPSDLRSKLDHNVPTNPYNDHYAFLSEEDARNYYNSP